MPDDVQKLLDNYNQALDRDTQTQMNALETARMNSFANINNAAKARGMLHSNYPELKQVQYLGNTYAPAVAKLQSGLLTTKDTIKKNAQDLLDQIEAYNASADRLNSVSNTSSPTLYTAGWDTPAVQGNGTWTPNTGAYSNNYTGSWDVNGYRWLWNANTGKFELAGKAE